MVLCKRSLNFKVTEDDEDDDDDEYDYYEEDTRDPWEKAKITHFMEGKPFLSTSSLNKISMELGLQLGGDKASDVSVVYFHHRRVRTNLFNSFSVEVSFRLSRPFDLNKDSISNLQYLL